MLQQYFREGKRECVMEKKEVKMHNCGYSLPADYQVLPSPKLDSEHYSY